jgi:molybdate transport system substrate-binding protein
MKMLNGCCGAKKALLALLAIYSLSSHAEEIIVLTSGIMKGSFEQIVPEFEKQTGNKIKASWGPSAGKSPEASQNRIRSGEYVDVLLMVNTSMDQLVKEGVFTPLDRRDVAVSKIGVAVKKGNPVPDISTADALRSTLLAAKSVGFSEGASGTYIENVLFQKLGISSQMAPKSVVILGRKFVSEALVDNEVDLGMQQVSELRLDKGITLIGPLPSELQKYSTISAAVSGKSTKKIAAKQFVDFLSTPFAKKAIENSGNDLPK